MQRLLAHPDAFGEIYNQAAPPHVKVTDACGPDMVMMLLHALFGRPLDQPTLEGIRTWLLDHNQFTPTKGTNLNALQVYCAQVANVSARTVDANGLHNLLKARAGLDGIGLLLLQAHNMPGNEQGVFQHFVAVFGYDDAHDSYLIGNPDDLKALGGHRGPIPARWITWPYVASAAPAGALVIGGGMGIPSGWSDSAKGDVSNAVGVLTAPGGVPIDHNIRKLVLTTPWSAANTPLGAAYYTPQVELSNPASGFGRRQDFRYASIATKKQADGSYAPAYLIPLGQDVQTLRAQLAAVQQQLADITAHGLPNVGSIKTSVQDGLANLAKIQADLAGIQSSLGE